MRILARLLSKCLIKVNSRTYRTTRSNIRHCFPELNEVEQLALIEESVYHFCCRFTELGICWYWRDNAIQQAIVEVRGMTQLEEHLEKFPVILLVPHLGLWELNSFILGPTIPTTVLYSARRLGPLESKVKETRERFGLTLVNSSISGLRRLLSEVEVGRLALILPDQVPIEGRCMIAPFFGNPALTTTLIYSLLQRKTCKVCSLVVKRVPKGFEVHIDAVSSDIYAPDRETSVQAMNDAVEQLVRRSPEQYQWEYKRFRRIPGQDIYA